MGMEKTSDIPSNISPQLRKYLETEDAIKEVKANISGEKSKAELDALIAERDRLIADLEEQRGLAQEDAEADNAEISLKREHIRINSEGINKRKQEIELYEQRIKEITKEIEEITGKKIKQEGEQPDIETLKQSNEAFLSGEFHWFKNNTKRIKEEVHFEKPAELNYKTLSEDINEQKFGEYILNPDTQNIDFEKARLFIPDLSQFVGKPIFEVMEYVVTTYSATYHIPGIEYWKWIIENENKAPQKLKDGDYYYFPGSLLRCFEDGSWNVPSVDWGHDKFHSSANGLSGVWCTGYHVVLLEKEKQSAEK